MSEARSILLTSPLRDGFRLGDRTFRPQLLRLDGPGFEERIEPQIAGVLLLLAERAGETVSRAEFFERVWEGRFVSEDVLHRAISRLRTLLGDDARAPRVIATIPKLGYRLLPRPQPLAEAALPPASPLPPYAAPAPASPATVLSRRAGEKRVWLAAAGLALAVFGWLALRGPRLASPSSSEIPSPAARPSPLVALPGIELQPAISPDGRWVAFSWDGEDGRRRIYSLPATSDPAIVREAGPRRLSDPEGGEPGAARDEFPVWSRDGGAVHFVRHADGACSIRRRELASGVEVALAACSPRAGARLTGSPSGETLYWSDLPEANRVRHAIRSFDLATRTTRWVTSPLDEREDLHPAVSPDGRWLAFSRAVPGAPGEILRLELPAGAAQRVVAETCNVFGLAWEDAEHLVVSRSCGGQEPGLWRLPIDGRPGAPLEVGGDRRSPSVPPVIQLAKSPVLRQVVFESWRERANLVVAPLAAGDEATARTLAPSTRRDHSPALSPDGRRVVFVSDRTGVAQLWSMAVDGSDLARLTAFEGAFPSRPAWSPDGRQIVFTRWQEGAVDLCLVARDGGEPRCFEDGAGVDVAPIFDATGTFLIYGSDREPSGAWRIWRRAIAGGAPEPMTEHGVWPIRELDGDLYYMDFRTDGLRRRARDGSDTLVQAEPPYGLASAVAIDGATLRFARLDGVVVRCALTGGSCRELGRLPGLHLRSGLILLGDPVAALYARHDKPDVEILSLALATPSPASR